MNFLPLLFTQLRYPVLACVLVGVTTPALAAKAYSDKGDGSLTDPSTGLTWMRCSVGQTWTDSTCAGTAATFTSYQANALSGTVTFADLSDWRLPSIRELMTIADRSVYHPAIDTAAFPNTQGSNFWSATADAEDSDSLAWGVDFDSGAAGINGRNNAMQVRLVRSGQSLGLLDVARPSADYVDQQNGTVTHMPTGLVWQRCPIGQAWTNDTCSGTPSSFTWDAARLLTSTLAGQTDWRLPTAEELVSLVDYTKYGSAINTTLFPNTLASEWFWSASAYKSDYAWCVAFLDGGACWEDKSNANWVRLVRSGSTDPTPGVLDRDASAAKGGDDAVATNLTRSSSITVSLTREPSIHETGVMTVLLPRDMAPYGAGFSFPLPHQVAQMSANSSSPTRVTMSSGEPLPSWLTFDPETKSFMASPVPDGAFPLQILMTIAGNLLIVVISQGSE